jgi:hypothetical protein
MADYSINKGIGRSAEFKGLKSGYLFLFCGGLLGLFILFVVMYLAGISQTVCLLFGAVSALVLVAGTFHLNEKYGEHGLLKLQASLNHPRFIINRKRIPSLFTRTIKRRKK